MICLKVLLFITSQNSYELSRLLYHSQGAKSTTDYFSKHQTNIKDNPYNSRNLKPFELISRPGKHQININL